MKLILPFIICILVWKVNLYAQYPPNLPQQDCIHATPVCDPIIYESNSYQGDGNILAEIDSTFSCLSRSEQNGAWYLIHILDAGDLCFTITPDSARQDIDWAVFDLTNATCSDIKTDPSLEVSCNFITNAGPCSGITGADGVTGGICGFQHAPCIPSEKGNSYLLYISSYSLFNGGYTVDFSASTATLFDNNPIEMEAKVRLPELDQLQLTFSKPISCKNLNNSSFSIMGSTMTNQVSNLASDDCSAGSDYESSFVLDLQSPVDLDDLGQLELLLNDTVREMCGLMSPTLSSKVLLDFAIEAQPDQDTLCSTDELILGTNLPPGTNLRTEWEPGAVASETYSPDLSSGASFTANIYASNGLLLGSSQKDFVVLPGPSIFIGNDTSFCSPDTIALTAKGSFTQLVWSNNETSNAIEVSESGVYWAEVSSSNGCVNRDSVLIDAISSPVANFDIEGSGSTLTLIASCTDCISYQWEISDGTMGSGIEVTHTFTQSGQFFITLIVSNSCGSDTVIRSILIDLTSLEGEEWEGKLKLFPNPSSNFLFIQSYLSEHAQANLFNSQGQRVLQGQLAQGGEIKWDVMHLPAGLYVCEIQTKEARFIRKVLID